MYSSVHTGGRWSFRT